MPFWIHSLENTQLTLKSNLLYKITVRLLMIGPHHILTRTAQLLKRTLHGAQQSIQDCNYDCSRDSFDYSSGNFSLFSIFYRIRKNKLSKIEHSYAREMEKCQIVKKKLRVPMGSVCSLYLF